MDGVDELRRFMLRTLNDNQLLILSRIEVKQQSMTGHLRVLSETRNVPLSTLKLNARILREYNLINYGQKNREPYAEILPLGRLILKLVEVDKGKVIIKYSD